MTNRDEQLRAFDDAIYEARRRAIKLLLVMPDDFGKILLDRAAGIFQREEDYLGWKCPETLISVFLDEIVVNNGSIVRHTDTLADLSNEHGCFAVFLSSVEGWDDDEYREAFVMMPQRLSGEGAFYMMLDPVFFELAEKY